MLEAARACHDEGVGLRIDDEQQRRVGDGGPDEPGAGLVDGEPQIGDGVGDGTRSSRIGQFRASRCSGGFAVPVLRELLFGDGASALPGPQTAHAQGRCGYGPRLPLLVVSPFAKKNYVDHTLTDQTSVLRFIEDNWLGGERVGGGSFDAIAGPITGMFDFAHPDARPYLLNDSTGVVVKH